MWKEDKLSFDQVYGTYEFPDRKGVLNWSIYRSGHFSIARAFGIGLPLAAQLRRGHWNRPAAARTSRPSPGMAGICMHVHPGRGHAARPATSQFQRPLRGNPMPNAFHPRRQLTTVGITSPANGRRGGPKTPACRNRVPRVLRKMGIRRRLRMMRRRTARYTNACEPVHGPQAFLLVLRLSLDLESTGRRRRSLPAYHLAAGTGR